jgi:hypothetical protein
MSDITYTTGTNEQRQALAKRAVKLLLLLAKRELEPSKLATVIQNDNFLKDILDDKYILPITGLQWLRETESAADGINWYSPSPLEAVAVLFQGYVAGALPSDAEESLEKLELQFKDNAD